MISKILLMILIFLANILIITSSVYAQLPTPDMCDKCHAVNMVYQEWLSSKHNTIHCFDCHIPCAKQGIVIQPGEKKGFHILGYGYYDENTSQVIAVRLDGNQVCTRCHTTSHYSKKSKPLCIKCHMKTDGLTTYRVHSGKPISFDDMNNNIIKYVTRDHRIHTFLLKNK